MSKYKPMKQHAPIDETVQLPAAIRAAALRSEALHQQAYSGEEPSSGEEETPEVKAQREAEAAEAAEEVQRKAAEEANGRSQREQKAPNTEAPEKAKEGQEGAQARDNTDEDWKHRYLSMKGRHDQLAQQLASTNNRMADMERLIARLNSDRTVAPAQPASELSFKPIGAEERETYGDDFIDIAQRAALEKVSPEVARLNKIVEDLQSQLKTVTTTTQQTTTQNVYQTLDNRVPNWREINRDPNFLAWVGLPDPYSGVTRQQMMREAFENGDASRVLNFFTGFLNDEAATAPARAEKPDTVRQRGQKVPLESLAAPGRAKAPAASIQSAPGEKETISRAQISQFYLDVQKGKYKGNDDEKNRIERMIFEAEAEGRITN